MTKPLINQIKELFQQQNYQEVSNLVNSYVSEIEDLKEKKEMFLLSAQSNYLLSKNKEALKDILKAKNIIDKIESTSEDMINLEIQRAKILRRLGEKEESLNIYDKLLKEYEERLNEETKAVIFHNLANLYLEKGNFEQSKLLFEQAIEVDKKQNNEMGIAQSLAGLGGLFFYIGEFDKAIDYYKRSLKFRSKVKDQIGEATLLFNLGSIYANMLDEKNAISYLSNAEKIFKKLEHNKGENNVLKTKVRMYYSLKDYLSVVKNLQDLQQIQINEIDSQQLDMLLLLIESLLKIGKNDEANHTIDRTLSAIDSFDKKKQMLYVAEKANLMHLKSQYLFQQKNYDKSLVVLNDLEKLAHEHHDEKSLIAINFSKSQIFYSTNELDAAKEIAQIGLKEAMKQKDSSILAFLDLLFGICWKKSEFQECIKHLKDLSQYSQISKKIKLELILRTLEIAEDEKVNKINMKDYEALESENQILLLYQDVLSMLFTGKMTLSKFEKIYKELLVHKSKDSMHLASHLALLLNLIEIKQNERDQFFEFLQNRASMLSILSRIARKQVLSEDIRDDIEGTRSKDTCDFEELMTVLDIIYFSTIFGFISKKYLFEYNWSDKIDTSKKIFIDLKQKMLINILINEYHIKSDINNKITTTNAEILFEKIHKNPNIQHLKLADESQLLLQGIIVDLIIRTLIIIDLGELNGTKTEETD